MESLTGDDPVQVAGYQVRARLGAGGMGRVYLAFTAGGRPVALKVIRPELGDDRDFRGRFRQEVEAARRVHGLYTAEVIDADPAASPPWLVTAYVPGPSLQDAVGAHGPLPVDVALLLMASVAEALQAIHAAGLVHRDLKPSNVLLAADGPRVIDFGIARAIEATTVTRPGMRVGSPAYMSPEQVQGLSVTPATDVFALGSVVGYAATGRLPFGLGNEHALLYRIAHAEPDLDGYPEPVRALIGRCLAKAPKARPVPGEIIEECRARTSGRTLQIAQGWLPAAVSAGLAQHAPPPPFPTPATAAPRQPGPGGPAGPGGPVPVGAVPPGMPPWMPPGGMSPPGPVPPGAGTPRSTARLGTGWFVDRARGTRMPFVAGLAAVAVVALVGGGVALGVNLSSHGGSSGTGPSTPAGSGSQVAPATAANAANSPTAGPPSSQSASTASCLIGNWQSVNDQITLPVDGQQTTFSGAGALATFRANGTVAQTYNKESYRTANGTGYVVVIQGTQTAHWTVDGSEIFYTSLTSNGTVSVSLDGLPISSQPLDNTPSEASYQCSGDMARETFTNAGGTETNQWIRVSS